METIAVDISEGVTIYNPRPDLSAGAWREGMWCESTLGPGINLLMGWDGLIHAAYDAEDESPAGYWRAET